MLTVVIPSYNHEKYILDCLNAVSKINIDGIKVIVIDDGSTDHTVQQVEHFMISNQYPIKIIKKEHSGVISSLNFVLNLIDTEFSYWGASDDIPNPEGIKQCVTLLQTKAESQFCIGNGFNFFDDGIKPETPIYGKRHEIFFNMPTEKRNTEIFINYPSPLLFQTAVFRVTALRAVGGWDQNLLSDDYAMFVRLFKKYPKVGKDFLYKPDFFVVRYRHHKKNSYKNIEKQFYSIKQLIEYLAPNNIKDKAIANAMAYYILVCIRTFNFSVIRKLIGSVSWKVKFYSVCFIPNIVLKKIGFISD